MCDVSGALDIDVEHNPAVQRPVARRIVRHGRLALAEALGLDTPGGDTLLDQVLLDGIRTTLAKALRKYLGLLYVGTSTLTSGPVFALKSSTAITLDHSDSSLVSRDSLL